MKNPITISVSDIVGDTHCVASADGKKIYRRILPAIKKGNSVVLSFSDVEILTSAFLNTAIGELYGKLSEKDIRASLKIQDIEQDDIELIKHVVDNAKRYFKDPRAYNQALEDALDG